MSVQVAEELFQIIKENRSFLEIPTEYDSDIYFPKFVLSKLDDYYLFLNKNSIGKIINKVKWDNKKDVQFLNTIRGLKNSINDSINFYYNGKIAKAYERFNSTLDAVVLFRENTVVSTIQPNFQFYRIRAENETKLNSRSDNFHIKFDLRHFCRTQRYSLPGIPSLYLGDTAFICFQELNRPNYSNAYISRFELMKPVKVIEIKTINSFIQMYEDNTNSAFKLTHVLRFLLLYPLYFACRVKVSKEGSFKPEYIIPQLLLQYISNEDTIKGIKFPSTKVKSAKSFRTLNTYNYVFPTEKSKEKGFCEFLSSAFKLTNPLSFESIIKEKPHPSSLRVYSESVYNFIEKELEKEKLDYVNNNDIV